MIFLFKIPFTIVWIGSSHYRSIALCPMLGRKWKTQNFFSFLRHACFLQVSHVCTGFSRCCIFCFLFVFSYFGFFHFFPLFRRGKIKILRFLPQNFVSSARERCFLLSLGARKNWPRPLLTSPIYTKNGDQETWIKKRKKTTKKRRFSNIVLGGVDNIWKKSKKR